MWENFINASATNVAEENNKLNNILLAQSIKCISPWPSCLSLSEAFFTVAFMLTIMIVSLSLFFIKLYYKCQKFFFIIILIN